jgi:hypothetical protein
VFEIASYKGLVIALILVNGELLKIELFDDTCAEFWDKNVTVHEKKLNYQNKIIIIINLKIRLLLVITVAIKTHFERTYPQREIKGDR